MHQFSKVEMFVLCTPRQSEAMLAELCGLEEEIFTELGLHFRMLVQYPAMHSCWVVNKVAILITACQHLSGLFV